MSCLTGDDLARPAKDLPLKVIRDLGHMLHRAQYNSGNWETIAEDLGYEYEEIKHFNTMANVRQEVAPGELMLRDWVQRFNGRTLFVLHSALMKAERLDCVDYLESEIYKRVVCMELMVCVRHEDCKPIDHLCVTTRAESNLLDSLQNILDQPLPEKYKLLDQGVSWTGTKAREFKGRQLMLMRKSDVVHMEQDPTIDSSGLDMSGMDESVSKSFSQSSVSSSSLRTSQNSVTTPRLGSSHTIMPGSRFQQNFRRVERNEQNIHFQGCISNNQTLSVVENVPVLHGKSSGKTSTSSPSMPNRNGTPMSHNQAGVALKAGRLVLSSNDYVSSRTGHNNLGIISEKRELSPSQQDMNISDSDGKVNNVTPCKEYSAAFRGKQNTSNGNIEIEADMVTNRMDITETCNENSVEDNRACTLMECPTSQAVGTDVDDWNCEYREFGEYKDPSKYRDFGKLHNVRNIDVSGEIGEYSDPCEYRYSGQHRNFCEYRDPERYIDPSVHDISSDTGIYLDSTVDKCKKGREHERDSSDPCEYRDPSEYRDPIEYRDPSEYRDFSEYRDSSDNDFRFTSGGFDTEDILRARAEIQQTCLPETDADQVITKENPGEKEDVNCTADYQFAAEDFHDNDDSITILKQTICSRDLDKTQSTRNGDIESEPECSIQHSCRNVNTLSDFDSDTYNTHPEFQRIIDDGNSGHADMHIGGMGEGDIADSDHGISKDSKETRVYLDFNQYDQGNISNTMDEFRASVENTNTDLAFEKAQGAMDLTSARIPHQPPRRFFSEVASQSSGMTRDRKMYETLQRGVSCPSDIVYEKSLVFSEEHNMVTIADVFSPVSEESKIKDFEMVNSGEVKPSVSLDSTASSTSKRHSLPMCRPGQNTKRTRFQRHTFQHGDKAVRFDESFEEQHSRTMQDSPQLPPRGRLPPLSSSSSKNLSRCRRSDSDVSMQSAQGTQVTGHICKIVVGGKSSRPALDGLLADDILFTHYNAVLCSFPGWSPRETEHTIEKTMRDAVSSDGYYILWYIRGRKNLVLSVSFRGTLVHYRVHTKVLTGKLHYYITQGRYFDDIIQLLHHYLQYGMRAPAGSEGGHSGSPEHRIPLRCPVLVQYERRPAVSV
ncbi:uncharacterized protein LOC123528565 [Mercenaria mercenaria]|uniref:uncharacterized protein LOC123528565 n=1 Tax=Mercenaria mercenaria TaxID=6596 RepID=UPI00234F916B|nr:uncharacterized protein LOC123528565 [Mercenaria mercenaria]XP_045164309.2 uncharacterized protein LOC123528565 [Mercenaria mercenaria]XP_045164310.2 uncharacterized protein LOC123528565 [Mercenaria mercenaria]